jgi:3-methyladenine DNA glycosylase AlkD
MTAIQTALRARILPGYAATLMRFFKTGPGEYGEGDRFLGIRIPAIREVARTADSTTSVPALLDSAWHEDRVLGLLILVRRFEAADGRERAGIVRFYLENSSRINNWDLVDISAWQILGSWLVARRRGILDRLAKSQSLWERRIAVVSTYAFIRTGDLADTFRLCRALLGDREALLHKACGWMLREAGKRDLRALEEFLDAHGRAMPRTMLRYAIEKFPESRRAEILRGKIRPVEPDARRTNRG